MVGRHGLPRFKIVNSRAVIGGMVFISRSLLEDTSLDMVARMNLAQRNELYNVRQAAQVFAYFALEQGGRAIDAVKAVKLIYSRTGRAYAGGAGRSSVSRTSPSRRDRSTRRRSPTHPAGAQILPANAGVIDS